MGIGIWRALASIQITTASLSFIASLAVAVSIGTVGLRDGPYKRIIFSLSAADIIQSFALIVGPFAPPASSVVGPWSVGNEATCSAQGTMFTFGICWFTMNSVFLCFYYLCKIKRTNEDMTDAIFSSRYEWKIHAFNIIYCLAISITSLSLGIVNPAITGTICAFSAFPTGCRQNPAVECYEPISTHAKHMITIMISMLCLCFIGVIVCMALILWRVKVRNKIFIAMTATTTTTTTTSVPAGNISEQENQGSQRVVRASRLHAEYLRKLYMREITVQACMFTGAFILCNGAYVAANLLFSNNVQMTITQNLSIFFMIVIFFPLSGLFTILIYTRPAIGHLRRIDRDSYTWLRAFVMVLKAGGEVPPQSSFDEDTNNGFIANEVLQQIKSEPYGVFNEHVIMSIGGAEYIRSDICSGKRSENYEASLGGFSFSEGGQGGPEGRAAEETTSRGLSLTPETNTQSSLMLSGLSISEREDSGSSEFNQRGTKAAFKSKDVILVRALGRAQKLGNK
jgi:hypothetical protein